MHVQLDTSIHECVHTQELIGLLDNIAGRFDSILDVVLTRYNIARMYGVIQVDLSSVLASACTGPILWSVGMQLDIRMECALYARTTLCTIIGGTLCCAYIRTLLRLHHTYSHSVTSAIDLFKSNIKLVILHHYACSYFDESHR